MSLPDSEALVFQSAIGTSIVYSDPIQVRREVGGVDVIRAARICVNGTISFGATPATLATFVVECAPASSGPWSPLGYFDTPAIASGIAVAPLTEFRWTRGVTGVHPSVSFEPDNVWIRVGAKMDQTGGSLALQVFASQQYRTR